LPKRIKRKKIVDSFTLCLNLALGVLYHLFEYGGGIRSPEYKTLEWKLTIYLQNSGFLEFRIPARRERISFSNIFANDFLVFVNNFLIRSQKTILTI